MNLLEFSWLFYIDKRKGRLASRQLLRHSAFTLAIDQSIDVNWCRPDIPKRKSRFVKIARLEWHSAVRRGVHRHDATQRLISIITRVNLKPLSIIIYAALRLIDESVDRPCWKVLQSTSAFPMLMLLIDRQSHNLKFSLRKYHKYLF